MKQLYDYQERAVQFHLAHAYSLNLCEMGLGKTVMALETARRAKGKVLIFCPAFLATNWRIEIADQCPELDYAIIPYSRLSLGDSIKIEAPTTIIADEIQYLSNPTAKRTQFFKQILEDLEPKYFIGLTGTPIKNRIPEFYSLLSMVSLNPAKTSGIDVNEHFRNRDHFASRYCHFEEIPINGRKIRKWHGFKDLRAAEFKSLLRGKVYKVRAEDVLDLPPIAHKKAYAELEVPKNLDEEFKAFLSGNKNSAAKKESALLKAPATIAYVEEMLKQDIGQIVIFTDHVESAKMIARHFKVPPIVGETLSEERGRIGIKFGLGAYPILVASIGAFSVGSNLTSASHLVFNDCSWVPANNLQALKRIHRIGQTKRCVIHYILAGHIDEFILDTLQAKLAVIDVTNALALAV